MTIERTGLRLELEATLQRFENDMRRAVNSGTVTATNLEKRFDAMSVKMQRSSTRASQGLSRMVNISSAGRFVLQNTAAQIGDIAVQLDGGTAAMRVFSQQLPQVLGGFGALGGVLGLVGPLLGTVAAVGLPLAAMLMATGGNAEEAAEKVQTFADKLSAAEAALGRADAAATMAGLGGAQKLAERYGDVTEKVRELANELLQIEIRAAELGLNSVLDEALGSGLADQIDRAFGDVGGALANVGTDQALEDAEQLRGLIRDLQAEIDTIRASQQAVPAALTSQMAELNAELAAVEGRVADIGGLADELIVSPDAVAQIAALRDRLQEAREAGNFVEVANSISDMRSALVAAGIEIDQQVIDKLTQAEDQARVMANRLAESEDIANRLGNADVSSGISSAADEAGRLFDNLASAIGLTGQVAERAVRAGVDSGAIPPQALNDLPQSEAERAYQQLLAQRRRNARTTSRTSSRRASGGRSRAAQVPQEVRQYERALEGLEDQFNNLTGYSDGYRASLEELRAEYAAGNLSADDFSAGVSAIEDRFTRAARASETLKDSAGRAFADIITGARSASDAIGGLLSGLANSFAQAVSNNLIVGSGAAGIFSGIGNLLSFDGGGYTGDGPRSGGVDGRGGFAAILHPRERVIDTTRVGGMGQQIYVRVLGGDLVLSDSGEVMSRVQVIAEGARQGAVKSVAAAMAKTKSFGRPA